jgi:hypothetical protein
MHSVQIETLPRSALGQRSVGLATAFILYFVLSEVLTGSQVLGPGYSHALGPALTSVLRGITATAFVAGLITPIGSGAQSVLIVLSTALGSYNSCSLENR